MSLFFRPHSHFKSQIPRCYWNHQGTCICYFRLSTHFIHRRSLLTCTTTYHGYSISRGRVNDFIFSIFIFEKWLSVTSLLEHIANQMLIFAPRNWIQQNIFIYLSCGRPTWAWYRVKITKKYIPKVSFYCQHYLNYSINYFHSK